MIKFEVVLRKSALISFISIAIVAVAALVVYQPRRDVAYLDINEIPVQPAHEIDNPIHAADQDSFLCAFENDVLFQLKAYKEPGLAIAIVKGDKLIYQKGFGYRNTSLALPVTTSTVFRIGSVSKGFAAALAGLLAESGVINWEDPVRKYIPDFQVKPQIYQDSLNLSHLLSHSAGYPYQAYSTMIEDNATLDEMIMALQELTLSNEPGYIHSYQNVAYSIIEKIIENVTDCSFQELMEERIFEPLHMTRASIDYASITNQQNVAKPHFYTGRGIYVGDISTHYYNASAAGGVNASISDMGKWLMAVMGNNQRIISASVLDSIFEPQIVTAVKNSYLSRLEIPRYGYYGRGWRSIEYPTDTIVYHEGYVNGYKSAMGFSVSNDIGICILSNSGNRLTSKILADFFKSARRLN